MRRAGRALRCAVLVGCAAALVVQAVPPAHADPGGRFFRTLWAVIRQAVPLTRIPAAFIDRKRAYERADQWRNEKLREMDQQAARLKQASAERQINVHDYGQRLVLIEKQKRDVTLTVDRFKSLSAQDFNRFLKDEAAGFLLPRIAESKKFKETVESAKGFLSRSIELLNGGIRELRQVERLFWPEDLRRAQDAVKSALKRIDESGLRGVEAGRLAELLRKVDEKLTDLHGKTRPRTVEQMRADLEQASGMVRKGREDLEREVGKMKKVTTEAARVNPRAAEDPVVKKYLAGMSERDSKILAPYVRTEGGRDLEERMARLGVAKEDPETQKKVRSRFWQKMSEASRAGQRLGKGELDRLLAEAATEVTGRAFTVPELHAGFAAAPDKGPAPLAVEFDASASTGDIGEYEWDFGDSASGSGKNASHTYEKPGNYSAILTVKARYGKETRSSSQTVTALPPVESTLSVSVEVKPPVAQPGRQVQLKAKVNLVGVASGKLSLTFHVDGTELATSPQEGELDYSPLEFAAAYTVSPQAAGREYSVVAKAVVIPDEETRKKVQKERIEASGQAPLKVAAAGDFSALAVRYREEIQRIHTVAEGGCCNTRKCDRPACTAKVDVPCQPAPGQPLKYCRVELLPAGEGKFKKVCRICACDIPNVGGITTFQRVLESPYWFDLDEGFSACFSDVIDTHLAEYQICFHGWASAPEDVADRQLDECLTKLNRQTEASSRKCQDNACEKSCAASGKRSRVRSLLSQECECENR